MRNQLLRDTDWAGMAHSLEIRVPLVDAQLLAQVAPLTGRASGQHPGESTGQCQDQPQGQGDRDPALTPKHWLAQAPSRPLPAAIVDRPKTGFSTPLSRWLAEPGANTPAANTYAYSRAWARPVTTTWGQTNAPPPPGLPP